MTTTHKLLTAIVFACAAMLVAPVADAAQRYQDRYDHRHQTRDHRNDAVVGAALAIGVAALIASHDRDRHYRRDRGYYYSPDYRYRGNYPNYGYRNHGYQRDYYRNQRHHRRHQRRHGW